MEKQIHSLVKEPFIIQSMEKDCVTPLCEPNSQPFFEVKNTSKVPYEFMVEWFSDTFKLSYCIEHSIQDNDSFLARFKRYDTYFRVKLTFQQETKFELKIQDSGKNSLFDSEPIASSAHTPKYNPPPKYEANYPNKNDNNTRQSEKNSFDMTLEPGHTFVGVWETDDNPDVMTWCKTSENCTLYFDFSLDGTDSGYHSFPVCGFKMLKNLSELHYAVKGNRYFRVRLVNDTEFQTQVSLYTYYGKNE